MVRFPGHEPGEQREFTGTHRCQHRLPPPPPAEDKLDRLNTTKMKRDVTETIKDYDEVHWMAGGIDLSLNDDTQRNVPICWQAQLYGFAEVSNREQFSKLLRDTLAKKTRKVTRPVQTEECDGSARAISYGFKNDFVRRIGYRGQAGST